MRCGVSSPLWEVHLPPPPPSFMCVQHIVCAMCRVYVACVRACVRARIVCVCSRVIDRQRGFLGMTELRYTTLVTFLHPPQPGLTLLS